MVRGEKSMRLAGVAGVTPLTFGHSVVTRLVHNPGVDLVTAATFLRHARPDTTAHYSRPSDEDLAGRQREPLTSGKAVCYNIGQRETPRLK